MTVTSYIAHRNHAEAGILYPDVERRLVCYRAWYWSELDYESVWEFVQRHHGYLRIGPDHCDYWIDPCYASLFVLAFDLLVPQPNLDYV